VAVPTVVTMLVPIPESRKMCHRRFGVFAVKLDRTLRTASSCTRALDPDQLHYNMIFGSEAQSSIALPAHPIIHA
jgi:hypothetical protein